MAAEQVGSIFYSVTADTSQLIGQERVVARETGKMAGSFNKMAAAVTAALSAIAVEGLVSKLVTAQRQFDVMFASLKTMTGGAEAAGKAWEQLVQFAAQTPFTLEQAVNGFTKLKALGLDPGQRALTSYGNTAAAMGKDLSQMIEAVADASTGEFERLKEFGIKARVEGDKVALTFRGTTTTVKNSSDEITEYLTRIGEVEFAGAMSERMKTLDGDISNLQDSLQALYLSISQSGAGEAIAAGVRGATEAIQELTLSIKQGELTEYFAALRPIITLAEVAVVSLAGAIAGRLVAAFVASATQAYASATAMGAATVATRGFTAVLAAMGGPVGIAITGLALLALKWGSVSEEARTAAEVSEQAANRIANALKKSPNVAMRDLAAQLKDVQGELGDIDKELGRTGANKASNEDLDALRERRDVLVKAAADIKAAMDSLHGGAGRGKQVNPDPVKPAPERAGSSTTGAGQSYLAGLRARATTDELAKINMAEQEALRRNAEQAGLSERDRANAAVLIQRDALNQRIDLYMRDLDEWSAIEDERDKRSAEAEKRRTEEEKRAAAERAKAKDIIAGGDPVARLQLDLERQSAALAEAAARDQSNAEIYAQAKIALERQTAAEIAAIRQRELDQQAAAHASNLAMASNMASSLYSVLERSGRERTALGKALFLANRAFAVAEILLNTEVAASKAMAQFGAYGTTAAMMIRAAGYTNAAVTAGIALADVSGGRQYGGPVAAGSLYRVNETGAPEMFTASNGNQFMMPTANGNVTPADQIGGGGGWKIIINNAPPGTTASVNNEARIVEVAVARAEANFVGQMSENAGPMFRALTSSTNVRGGQI